MEHKSVPFEMKDMSHGKREIVFAHAVYDNIDHYGDISRKGMFNKSWKENKANIGFYVNHDERKSAGKTADFWEDDTRAYTKAVIEKSAFGDDIIEMVDHGVINSASFGFNTMRREYKTILNRRVRELKEVKHNESTLVTYDVVAVNPRAGIISMTKTQDMNNVIAELQENIEHLETFCREAKATDETILSILKRIDELKAVFLKYEPTYAAKAPTPGHTTECANKLKLLTLKHFV